MHTFIDILNGNRTVTALVNFGGLIAFLVILFVTFRGFARFIRNAYHTSIKVAVNKFVRDFRKRVLIASIDASYLISYLSALIFVSIWLLVGMAFSFTAIIHQGDHVNWLVVATGYAYMIALVYTLFHGMVFSVWVRRVSRRRHERSCEQGD